MDSPLVADLPDADADARCRLAGAKVASTRAARRDLRPLPFYKSPHLPVGTRVVVDGATSRIHTDPSAPSTSVCSGYPNSPSMTRQPTDEKR